MKEAINNIFASDGIIKELKSDYIPRESQIEGANLFADALESNSHMLMEGPCGFGKTFSYLIPLALHMTDSDIPHRAIIVTNGIALSEQLLYKDLPQVSNIISKIRKQRLKYCIMKGKSNFLCTRKFAENSASNSIKSISNKLKTWMKTTKNGDFSELDFRPEYSQLVDITCVFEGECRGKSCSDFGKCYYQSHKRKTVAADIVVTNYHMLFSDYQSGHMILPDHDILIMDEAHEAPNIFRDFTAEEHQAGQFIRLRNKLLGVIPKMNSHSNVFRRKTDTDNPAPTEYLLYEELTAVASTLSQIEKTVLPSFGYSSYFMIKENTSIHNKDELLKNVTSALNELRETCSQLEQYLEDEDVPQETKEAASILSRLVEKMSSLQSILKSIDNADMQKMYAFYFEKGENSVKLCRKNVGINEIFCSEYFANLSISTCLLTSATLSVGNKFSFIKKETGLDLLEDMETDKKIIEFIGSSPFDLEHQQIWYLPESAENGDFKNRQAHEASFETIVPDIVNAVKGGILFLCSTNRNMNLIYEIIQRTDHVIDNNITVFKQGSAPTKKMSEMFAEDKESILVATKSFYTGVDIPGDALRCVVVDKFPFMAQDDPILIKITERDKGAFFSFSVPNMITSLKQAVGRGVRSVDDKCVIAFMDKRLSTARYAGTISKSFPYEKTRTRDPIEVEEFLYKK